MENTTQTPVQQFKRKARIGINPITIAERGTKFLEINSENIQTHFSENLQKDLPYLMATDLHTGEEGHFWLSGQLKHQFTEVMKSRQLKGMKFEITHKGKKKVEIDGTKTEVNEYDIYELE